MHVVFAEWRSAHTSDTDVYMFWCLSFCMLQAMAKDPKNYYQETWKQIRNKIKKFKNVPEQYGKYLESKKKQNSTEITS